MKKNTLYHLKTKIRIQIISIILVGTIFVGIFQFQVDGALKPKHQLNLSLQNIELDISMLADQAAVARI